MDNTVNVWDLATDTRRHKLSFGQDALGTSSLGFSPDGRTLLTACGVPGAHEAKGEIRFWDIGTGQLQTTVTDASPHALGRISAQPFVAFDPDGATFAIVRRNQSI